MYVLGAKSMAELGGVKPRLVAIVKKAITLTEQDFTVADGARTLEEQKEYVRRGTSKTMNSRHLVQSDGYGHAVDLVPWVNGGPRWEWGAIWPIAAAMAAAAKELETKIVWGGVWDRTMDQYDCSIEGLKREVEAYKQRHPGPDFLDGPHYELARGE